MNITQVFGRLPNSLVVHIGDFIDGTLGQDYAHLLGFTDVTIQLLPVMIREEKGVYSFSSKTRRITIRPMDREARREMDEIRKLRLLRRRASGK